MRLQRRNMNATNGMFGPLDKKRYSDQIADLMQKRILKDGLEIGTLLPTEKELAEEFQVSRSVIRESLRILEISGLVDVKKGPTGGIFVTGRYDKPIKSSLGNMMASGEVILDHLFNVRINKRRDDGKKALGGSGHGIIIWFFNDRFKRCSPRG